MAEERDDVPQATVVPARRTGISAVWIIPILAALIAIGIAVEHFISEGPTITITFKSADGIEAGKTMLKYKDVNVGQVTSVQFSDDYSRVQVKAKIAKNASPLMEAEPGPGVPLFMAVVVLTMLASKAFDSRLLWDAARAGGRHG